MGSTADVLRMSTALQEQNKHYATVNSALEDFSKFGYFPSSLSKPQPDPKLKQTPFKRIPPFPIGKLQGSLPLATIAKDVDHATIISNCLQQLDHFDSKVFTDDAIWRDLCSLTGTLRTFNTRKNIESVWAELFNIHHQCGFVLTPNSSKIVSVSRDSSWIQARFSFVTTGSPKTLCSGQIGVVPTSRGKWKIWMLTTILEELLGYPNPDFMGPQIPRASLNEGRPSSNDFECVVVGAGYGGLCLAGRLQAMNVRYVTLERNLNIGDNWRNRYDSARFHTSRDSSDMPLGRVFTQDDPYFLSGQGLARGYQKYVDKHQINIWLSTTLDSADFNQEDNTWILHITRGGVKQTLKTPHFVMAIGAGGTIPVTPQLPNKNHFKGTVMHSVDYKNAKAWKGKRGVIIGAGNTAHDVAEDMLDAGLESVTMIQRGKTAVFPIEYYKMWSDAIYNAKFSMEEADRMTMATPIAITRLKSLFGNNSLAAIDSERFDSLESAGFRVDRLGDMWKLLSGRLGGYYMDVGTSAKIAAGLIKMKGDSLVTGFTPTGLKFANDSTLDADVIIFCTGFEHDVRKQAVEIVGPEIGERLEDYWELDEEGEIRGAYKRMSYPGIWYQGGGVTYARFYSRFLALQIKADVEGAPLKLYTKKPAA